MKMQVLQCLQFIAEIYGLVCISDMEAATNWDFKERWIFPKSTKLTFQVSCKI